MAEKKLLRVELEWSDGEIVYLDGLEAERWDNAVKRQSVWAGRSGQSFPTLIWKTKKLPVAQK